MEITSDELVIGVKYTTKSGYTGVYQGTITVGDITYFKFYLVEEERYFLTSSHYYC